MHEAFVQDLIRKGVLYSDRIIEAFKKVRRIDFIHKDLQPQAYEDAPLPIGHNQTISQPSTVAMMLELLRVHAGDRVLEVGCGSGWLTALLSELVGASGMVYAIDIIPEMVDLTKEHLTPYHLTNVEVRYGNGWKGFPEYAPYNRIVVSAATKEVPAVLTDQLARSGRLVIPIGGDIQELTCIEKDEKGMLHFERYKGIQFVPLVQNLHGDT